MAIVIGDIHGNLAKAEAFLAFRPDIEHVALGDYVDGPGGMDQDIAVLRLLLDSSAVLLWGNHELCWLAKNPFMLAGYDDYFWPEVIIPHQRWGILIKS